MVRKKKNYWEQEAKKPVIPNDRVPRKPALCLVNAKHSYPQVMLYTLTNSCEHYAESSHTEPELRKHLREVPLYR